MTIERIGESHQKERGLRIEIARKKAGYGRQGELATALSKIFGRSYSRNIVSRIEQGTRPVSADELTALAYLLDQSEEWLNARSDGVFNSTPERRSPEIVRSLTVPLSGRTVNYRCYPTVRAHSTTDWDHRPIDIHADVGMLDAA